MHKFLVYIKFLKIILISYCWIAELHLSYSKIFDIIYLNQLILIFQHLSHGISGLINNLKLAL